MLNKRHNWIRAPLLVSNTKLYKHFQCQDCNLEKATNRIGHKFQTYYFESENKRGVKITAYGVDYPRVPYGCGEVIEALLEDNLFEI